MANSIPYLKYFYYIGTNWSWKLAFILIAQEIKGEKKYGINTTGADELQNLAKSGVDISHATMYMPVSYHLLENVFKQLPLTNRNHFLDVGCGKGRALCVAVYNEFKKVSGIDFSVSFCTDAINNLKITQNRTFAFQQNVIHTNVLAYQIPDDVDCIFLFNPFDEQLMQHLITEINKSLQKNSRLLHIIYANPLYVQLFTNAGFQQIFYSKRMKYFEVSIMKIDK
jgi:SAM-dependent methyltransferase